MRSLFFIFLSSSFLFLQSCRTSRKVSSETGKPVISNKQVLQTRNKINSNIPFRTINTKNVSADELVDFASTLTGVRYKYGSAKKEAGFDCSGFITYVFNHFNIQVPRTTIQFSNAGKTVDPEKSKKGDLILFTGTDTTGWYVGHMGIITQNEDGNIRFIHSASGNNKGVMISGMSNYFITKFVKIIRVF